MFNISFSAQNPNDVNDVFIYKTIDLAFLAIPRKSFGFLTLLFSIPTAPTILLPDGWALNKKTRGQKGADQAMVRFVCESPAARVTIGSLNRSSMICRCDGTASEFYFFETPGLTLATK